MRFAIILILLAGCATRPTRKESLQVAPNLVSFSSQSVIQPEYPLIGTFTYSSPISDCELQESYNLRDWYDVPDDEITVLPNGDWLIDPHIKTTSIYGDIHSKGRMFYRVKGEPN